MISINYKRLTTLTILLGLLIITIGCGGGGGMSGSVGSNDTYYTYDINEGNDINSTTLTWDASTTNADGTPLTDLAGYKVYFGNSSGSYTVSVDIGNLTGVIISNLEPGTWCFAVTAYDTSGNESEYSDEACKMV